MNKIRKCNVTLDLENMVHMLIFLKHLNSWFCFVLLFLAVQFSVLTMNTLFVKIGS